RWDENGKPYRASADDAAYATAQLKGFDSEPVIAQLNMSWATRVRRADLVTFHVDGTNGSAVAGLTDCRTQARVNTPRPVWNPDVRNTHDFLADWATVPDTVPHENAFKAQWALFLKHVHGEGEFPWDLVEGARGVQ